MSEPQVILDDKGNPVFAVVPQRLATRDADAGRGNDSALGLRGATARLGIPNEVVLANAFIPRAWAPAPAA